MKKLWIAAIIAGLLWASMPSAALAKDEPSGWAKETVAQAIANGLVPQRLQSNYQAPITRGEFAELLVQTAFVRIVKEYRYSGYEPWTYENFLSKVKVEKEFTDAHEDYIKIAYALGAINGRTATTFAPNDLITRQEAATMIANLVHMMFPFTYTDNEVLAYKDYDQIADWAKPAIFLVRHSDIMVGVGDRFDYAGLFTREQAIATMNVINETTYTYRFALRGNVITNGPFDEITYTVGDDYVRVHFDESKAADNSMEWTLEAMWWSFNLTNSLDYFDMKKAAVIYSHNLMRTMIEILSEPTLRNEPVHIDYGYLTMKTLGPDYLLEFKFKKGIPGYANIVAGYTYGFPEEVLVEPKVIGP